MQIISCVTAAKHVVGNQNLIPNVSTAFMEEQAAYIVKYCRITLQVRGASRTAKLQEMISYSCKEMAM
jgi:hypothetical protein